MSGRDRTPPSTAESARCAELLARMTLAEKIAQLCAVWVTDLLEDGRFSEEKAGQHLAEGIGQVSRVAGVSGLQVREAAAVADAIQDYLRHNTRLGVPAILHEECLCGFQARGTTSFPQAIGLASAWNPDLVERIGAVIRKEMRAVGTHQALGPVLDLVRDPRWGRCEETFGEDPYLAACMGLAVVRGLQGDDLRTGIGATLKHFVAHGSSEGGRNEAPVSAGPRELRDCFMVPFERVVKETEVLSVMNAYHDIDGIPCAGSAELLTSILREEWGFGGIVVSDYEAVDQLRRMHFTAVDKAEAARQALEAGIDVELPAADCFGEPLASAVKSGRVSVELIDRAAMRVLAAKERLGLLDAAPSRQPSVDLSVIDSASHRSLSARAAGESLVLLKNDGVLPLGGKLASLAVIGPNAHSVRNLLGDYAFEAAYGVPVGLSEGTSILKGLEDVAGPGIRLNFSPGCDIGGEDSSGIEPAVRAAERSDAVVLAVGGRSGSEPVLRGYSEHGDTSGEGRDRAELGLPGVQEQLVRELAATGKPVVLVIVDGRPLALGNVERHAAAILWCWLPGKQGGGPIARALFGALNPAGRLPVTLPRETGQVPVHYNRHSASSKWDYIFGSNRPLYPFGHGLSYTQFVYGGLRLSAERIGRDETLGIAFEVRNAGRRDGDEVAQLYVRDEIASVVRPVKELKRFARLHLKAGEETTVKFRLPIRELAFHDRSLNRVVEAGAYEIQVGASSEDICLKEKFSVV